jgi:two-component system phosphate regulon response regulator OmpR
MTLCLLSAPHVLVVDGDARARSDVAAMLVAEGARATEAAGPDEALNLLRMRRFDAVILDYSLPGSGAVVLLVRFRSLGNGRDVPAVVVSALVGSAREKARAHVAHLSLTAYLDKPVTGHALAVALRPLIADL